MSLGRQCAAFDRQRGLPALAFLLQVWFGAVVGLIPFCIASFEFGKRIIIQRRCPACAGSGLVPVGGGTAGRARLQRLVKCKECGGFFPWISWR